MHGIIETPESQQTMTTPIPLDPGQSAIGLIRLKILRRMIVSAGQSTAVIDESIRRYELQQQTEGETDEREQE